MRRNTCTSLKSVLEWRLQGRDNQRLIMLMNGADNSKHCPLPLDPIWFLRPTYVNFASGISIGSAVFVGLTNVTNRQTDHATQCVAIGRCHWLMLRCSQKVIALLLLYFEQTTAGADEWVTSGRGCSRQLATGGQLVTYWWRPNCERLGRVTDPERRRGTKSAAEDRTARVSARPGQQIIRTWRTGRCRRAC